MTLKRWTTKDVLLEGMCIPDSETNPFVREIDTTYMRFDRIVLSKDDGKLSGPAIIFYWKGEETCRMLVDDSELAAVGRVPIDIVY